MTDTAARDLTLALLAVRAPEASICPSEVARALTAETGSDWRDSMPRVHDAIDQMIEEGAVRLSWKGKPLATRAGPYRISRGSDSEHGLLA